VIRRTSGLDVARVQDIGLRAADDDAVLRRGVPARVGRATDGAECQSPPMASVGDEQKTRPRAPATVARRLGC
jgi:hypothetical protein